MRSLKSGIAALALISIFVVAAPIMVPRSAHGGPTVSGTVTALQGGQWSVGITGTPSVNVSNLSSVGIDPSNNVVTIGNPADNPLAVRDVATTPERYKADMAAGSSVEVVPQVPAGRTFVVTYVNAMGGGYLYGQSATTGYCLMKTSSGLSMYDDVVSIPMVPLSGVPPAGDRMVASQQIFLPVNAGESLVAVYCASAPYDANHWWVTVGGYSIPTH